MNLSQIVYLLGITNIVALGLVFFSCRCLAGQRITEKLAQYSWYSKFYQKHCLWWWVLAVSVLLHSTLAFVVFGNPI